MAEFDLPKRVLYWYTICVAASVLVLICSGGLVTSHEAGMAVPDWPNSFGYMFLFDRKCCNFSILRKNPSLSRFCRKARSLIVRHLGKAVWRFSSKNWIFRKNQILATLPGAPFNRRMITNDMKSAAAITPLAKRTALFRPGNCLASVGPVSPYRGFMLSPTLPHNPLF
jgi:hypothetical protein